MKVFKDLTEGQRFELQVRFLLPIGARGSSYEENFKNLFVKKMGNQLKVQLQNRHGEDLECNLFQLSNNEHWKKTYTQEKQKLEEQYQPHVEQFLRAIGAEFDLNEGELQLNVQQFEQFFAEKRDRIGNFCFAASKQMPILLLNGDEAPEEDQTRIIRAICTAENFADLTWEQKVYFSAKYFIERIDFTNSGLYLSDNMKLSEFNDVSGTILRDQMLDFYSQHKGIIDSIIGSVHNSSISFEEYLKKNYWDTTLEQYNTISANKNKGISSDSDYYYAISVSGDSYRRDLCEKLNEKFAEWISQYPDPSKTIGAHSSGFQQVPGAAATPPGGQ